MLGTVASSYPSHGSQALISHAHLSFASQATACVPPAFALTMPPFRRCRHSRRSRLSSVADPPASTRRSGDARTGRQQRPSRADEEDDESDHGQGDVPLYLEELPLPSLRSQLQRRGLSAAGTRRQLTARLTEALQKEAPADSRPRGLARADQRDERDAAAGGDDFLPDDIDEGALSDAEIDDEELIEAEQRLNAFEQKFSDEQEQRLKAIRQHQSRPPPAAPAAAASVDSDLALLESLTGEKLPPEETEISEDERNAMFVRQLRQTVAGGKSAAPDGQEEMDTSFLAALGIDSLEALEAMKDDELIRSGLEGESQDDDGSAELAVFSAMKKEVFGVDNDTLGAPAPAPAADDAYSSAEEEAILAFLLAESGQQRQSQKASPSAKPPLREVETMVDDVDGEGDERIEGIAYRLNKGRKAEREREAGDADADEGEVERRIVECKKEIRQLSRRLGTLNKKLREIVDLEKAAESGAELNVDQRRKAGRRLELVTQIRLTTRMRVRLQREVSLLEKRAGTSVAEAARIAAPKLRNRRLWEMEDGKKRTMSDDELREYMINEDEFARMDGDEESGPGGGEMPRRLLSALSWCRVASREDCRFILQAGGVTVNGQTVREPGHPVNLLTDEIIAFGQKVEVPTKNWFGGPRLTKSQRKAMLVDYSRRIEDVSRTGRPNTRRRRGGGGFGQPKG
ncbi:unnamed protein product [Vitrella brassicaformis CCMP3155]|uniref:SAP domain-containing protein n=3 Tax=Vitrella brassicaformis TaxID=1169539 RepID=A0A0G4EH97_VITBC|nr:unnamed protein product [Vitrella brassicaformis CCMP3155]|eukprot:CEL95861.1 unnamed protein product [Vitrella brassicaformis CCMP3155]